MTFQPSASFLQTINSALNELKVEFHRTGRYDDSNTKLDEITKLLVIKFMDAKQHKSRLTVDALETRAKERFDDKSAIAKALLDTFSEVASDPIFINPDGSNIFGSNPSLNIQPTDNAFAKKTLNILEAIHLDHGTNLDLLNETFGHFIRDNFRNHKEDAQYMTPSEVVDAMAEIVLLDILDDPESRKRFFNKNSDFAVLDPVGGVGSFMTAAYRKMAKAIEESDVSDKKQVLEARRNKSFMGQDKVDRMVRLSKINALFYDLNPNLFVQGNSILGDSYIDQFIGKIDVILTNPPFGATFTTDELFQSKPGSYELLKELNSVTNIKTLDSELIMLERSLELLRPGGRMLIVVPDGVVSAKGTYETYRRMLPKKFIVKGVIDLPAVTFAQAGTRTRCSIVYIQKPYKNVVQNGIFMAVADNIGYEVKNKLGAPVKIHKGNDELVDIVESYKLLDPSVHKAVIREDPSVVVYPFEELINDKWNANFYRASRLNILSRFEKITDGDFEIKQLDEISDSVTKERKSKLVSERVKHISVLHVGEDSIINVDEVMKYDPIGAGLECKPYDILVAKINPRIPRITVLPEFDFDPTCSREFEAIRAKNKPETYLLKTMLLSDVVQKQINSLTSGTSSSHNRIKTSELMSIQIPWPKNHTKTYKDMMKIAATIEDAELAKYEAKKVVRLAHASIASLVNL